MSNGTNNFSNFQNAFSNIQEVNTDYSPYIIKPPDRNKTHGSISKHIVVDSRDRNYTLYPNSNKYRIDLPQELRDVTSIELTLAQIPNTYYNISNNNNIFYISETPNNIVSINIPEGQYNNNSLIYSLNGKYGDLFYQLTSKYNFSRNPINLKLRIESNRLSGQEFIYNLNYLTNDTCSPCQLNSIDKTIGFINQQYQSEMVDLSYIYVGVGGIIAYGGESDQDYTLYKLVATQNYGGIEVDFNKIFYVNDYFILNDTVNNIQYSCQVYEIKNDFTIVFETLDKKNPIGLVGNIFNNISVLYSPNIFQVENKPYVVLKVKEAKSLESVGKSDGAFALIPLLNLENTIINQSTVPVHSLIKYFSVPIGKLYWMDIEFLNYDGTLFNFRGQENMMTFTITCLNQPGKYNNYVDSN